MDVKKYAGHRHGHLCTHFVLASDIVSTPALFYVANLHAIQSGVYTPGFKRTVRVNSLVYELNTIALDLRA